MQGVSGDGGAVQLLGQVERAHDLGELAAAVRANAVVVPGGEQVGEVQGFLPGGGDVDDPRRGATGQQPQQQPGEPHAGQVVHGETQLDAVGAGLAGGARPAEPDAGVVDEHVEPVGVPFDVGGEPGDLPQVGQVGEQHRRLGPAGGLDPGAYLLGTLGVPTMDEHPPARLAQPDGEMSAQAVGRTGDENRSPVHRVFSRSVHLGSRSLWGTVRLPHAENPPTAAGLPRDGG